MARKQCERGQVEALPVLCRLPQVEKGHMSLDRETTCRLCLLWRAG